MILFETNPWQFCLVINIYSLFSILKNAFYKMLKSSWNAVRGNTIFSLKYLWNGHNENHIISDTHHNNSYLKFSIFYEEIPNLAA